MSIKISLTFIIISFCFANILSKESIFVTEENIKNNNEKVSKIDINFPVDHKRELNNENVDDCENRDSDSFSSQLPSFLFSSVPLPTAIQRRGGVKSENDALVINTNGNYFGSDENRAKRQLADDTNNELCQCLFDPTDSDSGDSLLVPNPLIFGCGDRKVIKQI